MGKEGVISGLRLRVALTCGAIGFALASGPLPACANGRSNVVTGLAFANEPVVDEEGRCDPAFYRPSRAVGPRAVRRGIAECDLVRLKGPPLDVTVTSTRDGLRRAELLYGGMSVSPARYVFIDNRLVSLPRRRVIRSKSQAKPVAPPPGSPAPVPDNVPQTPSGPAGQTPLGEPVTPPAPN